MGRDLAPCRILYRPLGMPAAELRESWLFSSATQGMASAAGALQVTHSSSATLYHTTCVKQHFVTSLTKLGQS